MVVRSYFVAIEPDAPEFNDLHAKYTPSGPSRRDMQSRLVDEIYTAAIAIERIKTFCPAVAYVNHLTLFIHIWLMFMPLTLISSAGWYVYIFLQFALSLSCPPT